MNFEGCCCSILCNRGNFLIRKRKIIFRGVPNSAEPSVLLERLSLLFRESRFHLYNIQQVC